MSEWIRSPRTALCVAALAAALAGGWGNPAAAQDAPPDRFEEVRAHVRSWLARAGADPLTIAAPTLKGEILDGWQEQRDKYEIVSLRKPEDFAAGHLPHAVNVYWPTLLADSSLARLDLDKTLILYCYYGHASMLAGAILGLLGYDWRSLEFGMMGWNLGALVKEPWDGRADHPVETAENTAGACYPPPKLPGAAGDARNILKERAAAYLAGEGSPVIAAADLDTLVRDWERANAAYQIVDVRSEREYAAGHVPHAIHIPWARLADEGVLTQMDPKRTAVVCSENGQTGQLVATVLNLLGYPAVALKWGMMDWNSGQVAKPQMWAGAAGYPVEVSPDAGGRP